MYIRECIPPQLSDIVSGHIYDAMHMLFDHDGNVSDPEIKKGIFPKTKCAPIQYPYNTKKAD